MCLPMLKHLLIRFLALAPFWESYISIQITAMSDLGNTLSQMVTYLFCDGLKYRFKELISRVRQATKDVVKSEV